MPRLTVSDRHSGAESGRVLLCIPMVQRCAPSCVSALREHRAQTTKPAVAGSESPAPRLAGELKSLVDRLSGHAIVWP